MLAQFNSDDGFARTNRWELIITPPTGQRGNNLGTGNILPIITTKYWRGCYSKNCSHV